MTISNSTDLAVELRQVSKNFDSLNLFNQLNLSIPKYSHFAVLGEGGSGKSTLLKILIGLCAPSNGEVTVLGCPLYHCSRQQKWQIQQRIGVAFQQGALFDFLNVYDNIAFALENMTDFPKNEHPTIIENFISSVDLHDVKNKLPSELSGGMRRRVGLIRALCIRPQLFLLDEPTAGLDPVTTSIVIELIQELTKDLEATLICFTSNVEVAYRLGQTIAVLKEKKVAFCDTPKNLMEHSDPWLQELLNSRRSTQLA